MDNNNTNENLLFDFTNFEVPNKTEVNFDNILNIPTNENKEFNFSFFDMQNKTSPGNDTTNSVSPTEMNNISNIFDNITHKLFDYLIEINNNIKLLNESLKNLNSYNGQFSDLTTVDMDGQEMRYTWIIETVYEHYLETSKKLLEIEFSNVVKLRDFNEHLKKDTSSIEDLIQNIKKVLGVSLVGEFNSETFNSHLKEYNTLMDKFLNFNELIADNENKNDFRIQGMTIIDGKYFITAYDKSEQYNSRIYVYNETYEYLGKIILSNKSHVGGISYDPSNGVLFLTDEKDEKGNGIIVAYSFDLLNKALNDCKERNEKDIIYDFTQGETEGNDAIIAKSALGVGAASTVYGYNNRLFIGTFYKEKNGTMVSYDISKGPDGSMQTTNKQLYEIPSYTQGVAVTEYEGKEYLLTTQSYSYDNSTLQIDEMGPNGELTNIGKVQIDNSGAEGIAIVDNPDGSKSVTISYENVYQKGEKEGKTYDEYYNRTTALNSTCDFKELLTNVKGKGQNGKGILQKLSMETMTTSDGIELKIINN